MRRLLFIATCWALAAALPSPAQIHGVPPSVTSLGPNGFGSCCSRFPSSHFAFGHGPRFHVFFGSPFFPNDPFFFHRRHFFFRPILVPVPVYAGAPYPVVVERRDDYEDQRALEGEVRRLRDEVEALKEEAALREERDRLRQQAAPEEEKRPPRSNSTTQPKAAPKDKTSDEESPATLLLFRDGRRLEVRNYAIVGGTLWALSERQASKVLLSALDLEATIKLNNERGVGFSLPRR